MNKVYKVIWNKVKHCYVVVSEIAKSNGKSAAMKMQSGKSIAAALTVFALCLGMTGVVSAAENTEGTGLGVAIGNNSTAKDRSAVAVGKKANAQGFGSIAIGETADAPSNYAVVLGYGATAVKGGILDSSDGSVAIGQVAKVTGSTAVAIGYDSNAGVNSVALGASTQAASNSSAIGLEAKALGAGSAAFGYSANSSGLYSTAIGFSSNATQQDSTAIGDSAMATAQGSMAFGHSANSTGTYSTAIGEEAAATKQGAMAFGHSAKGTGLYSTAIGEKAEATAEGAMAFGHSANSTGIYSTAIGEEAAATKQGALAFGHSAKGTGNYSMAIGDSAKASGLYAVAIGLQSNASAESAVALGTNSIASITYSVALGDGSAATIKGGVVGYDPSGKYATDFDELLKTGTPWRSTLAAVSIGNSEKGSTRQITNVAAGTLDTDAVNVAQLKALNEKVDNSALSSGKNITVHTTTDTNGVKKNTIDLNDNITFGSDAAPEKEVKVDGTKGQVVIGNAAKGSGLVIGNQDVTTTSGKKASGKFITGLSNITWDKVNIVKDRAATEGELKDVSDSIKSISETVGMGTREFVGDEISSDKQVSVKLGETMNLKGGADVTNLSDGNIGVVTNSNKDGFDIKLSKDIKGLNSVTTGNATVNNNGLTIKNEDSSKNITIQNNNVNMGGNVITNIGEGTNPTDAINKNQFDREISQINNGMGQVNNRISKLDNRVDRVGAGAAALAALHPLDFDPTSRWEFSAGIGNYRGANAVAVGAFYRPNYDTMISLGSSYGGGENMVNAGVTFRIGEGTTKVYSSQDALEREVDSLRSVVDEQNRKLESQSQQLTAQNNKIESQSEQLAAQNNKLEAQNSKIEAQSQQLESQGKQLAEQSRQIEQLMQAVAGLKK